MWFLQNATTNDQKSIWWLCYSRKVASKQVVEKSLTDAVARLRGTERNTDAGVSVDDTWRRKGYSSMLEVVTAISIDMGRIKM